MRSIGSPEELARRRHLGVQRVLDGYPRQAVARFLGVSWRTVHRWMSAYDRDGWAALEARAVPGRPPRLTPRQTRGVLS